MYAPPAHAALALKEGPVVRSSADRFADTVEAMIRGITVGETLCMPPGCESFSWISIWVATSPVPLPATTAMSRRSRRDCASAASAALQAMSAPRPMKRACCLGKARSPR